MEKFCRKTEKNLQNNISYVSLQSHSGNEFFHNKPNKVFCGGNKADERGRRELPSGNDRRTMRSPTQLPPERQGLDEVYFAAETRRTSEDEGSYLPVMTDGRCAVQRSYRPKETSIRELSSVGSERLPYKQRVGGSTPSAPTRGWSKRIFGHPQTSFFERLYPSKPPAPLSRRISLFPVAVTS